MGAIEAGLALAAGSFRDEDGGGMFDFGGGVLPAGAALARTSGGTSVSAAGLVVGSAADIARFDHGDGRRLGLLVEPAATNLLSRSGAIHAAPWSAFGSAQILDSAAAAPDGTATALRVRVNSAAARLQAVSGLTPGAILTASVWARRPANGANAVRLTTTDSIGWNTGLSVRHMLTAGWRRIMLSGPLSAASTCALCIGSFGADGATDTECVGEIELWGAQIEAGAAATSLIPTTAAPAARAADLVTLNWGGQGVADGARAIRFTFGDGTGETRTCTISGGAAAVPGDLSRRQLVAAHAL